MTETPPRAELVELLRWYAEMGVDAAVAESAVDWTQRADRPPGADARERLKPAAPSTRTADPAPSASPQAPRPPRAPVTPVALAALPPAPDTAVLTARRAAAKAASLVDLAAALARFDGCGLKATAKNLCFYRGAEKARVMLIGEAPGREEDLEGRPFVGRAGQLLDKMLAAIALSEADVHITNIVYWRPPGNRTPTPQEAQVCRPFLERQVELVAPDIVFLLGAAASRNILNTADSILRIRGRWRDITIGTRAVRALPTLHPAYLLRSPAAKRQAWRDLLTLRAALD
jgi:DNA polymerase